MRYILLVSSIFRKIVNQQQVKLVADSPGLAHIPVPMVQQQVQRLARISEDPEDLHRTYAIKERDLYRHSQIS